MAKKKSAPTLEQPETEGQETQLNQQPEQTEQPVGGKSPLFVNGKPVRLPETPEEVAEMMAMVTKLQAEVEKKQVPARPRKLTPEQAAAAAARAQWENVELAEEGSVLRRIQDLPRITQVDATPKLIRMLKHQRVGEEVKRLIELVMQDTGRDFMDVFTEATTRQSKIAGVEQKVDVMEAEKLLQEQIAAGASVEAPATEETGEETDEEREARLGEHGPDHDPEH